MLAEAELLERVALDPAVIVAEEETLVPTRGARRIFLKRYTATPPPSRVVSGT
jgi:hypothetical protein